jgi:hypothetical protein
MCFGLIFPKGTLTEHYTALYQSLPFRRLISMIKPVGISMIEEGGPLTNRVFPRIQYLNHGERDIESRRFAVRDQVNPWIIKGTNENYSKARSRHVDKLSCISALFNSSSRALYRTMSLSLRRSLRSMMRVGPLVLWLIVINASRCISSFESWTSSRGDLPW